MASGTYVGPVERLRGERALLMDHPNPRYIRVQFDNLELGPELTHGWTDYAREDWEVDDDSGEG